MSHAGSYEELLATEGQRYHTFINIALFLAAITGVEIVIIFLPFSYALILGTLAILSVVKFICVILWFMHLIYDKMLLLLLFVVGMVLATGTMIALLALLDPEDVDWSKFSYSAPPAIEQTA